jgi:GNAT superfamily N-acetyltransferase
MLYVNIGLAQRLERVDVAMGIECGVACNEQSPDVDASAERVGSGIAVWAGANSPLSLASGLGMRGPVLDGDLDHLTDFYRQRDAAASVWVNPFADPSLLEGLGKRGFRVSRFGNMLVRTLDPADANAVTGDNMVKVVTADASQSEEWVNAAETAFGDVPTANRAMASTMFHRPSSVEFFAKINGEIAAVASMAIHDGVATLSTAATLPRFRSRGVHAALLSARVAYAAANGCDLAAGMNAPGTTSQRNTEKAGFRVIYTEVLLSNA